MTLGDHAKLRLAALMMRVAERGLRRKHSQWADAMAGESAAILSDDERLRWSAGCALASCRAPYALNWAIYPGILGAGVALMTAYQWSADESLGTVAVLSLIGLALGVLQPGRFWISGAAVGLVVAAVNTFETITGVRPAYETYQHTFLHDARWAVLVAPALMACGIGAFVSRKLQAAASA